MVHCTVAEKHSAEYIKVTMTTCVGSNTYLIEPQAAQEPAVLVMINIPAMKIDVNRKKKLIF